MKSITWQTGSIHAFSDLSRCYRNVTKGPFKKMPKREALFILELRCVGSCYIYA